MKEAPQTDSGNIKHNSSILNQLNNKPLYHRISNNQKVRRLLKERAEKEHTIAHEVHEKIDKKQQETKRNIILLVVITSISVLALCALGYGVYRWSQKN